MTRDGRMENLVADCIERFELDLSGLTILTEAASGAYLHTPVLAASAGAEHVHAVTADSRWATGEAVRDATTAAARAFGVADRLTVRFDRRPDALAAADVVTNSGFVRPIDRKLVEALKPTAVIPLMWETWEYREEDFDLAACRERGILVLGTDESRPPCDMSPYTGLMGVRLLFDLGLEVHRTRVLLLGSQPSLAGALHATLTGLGAEVTWFGAGPPAPRSYDDLPGHVAEDGNRYDAVIVAEHGDPRPLLGRGALVEFDALPESVRLGLVSGSVDADGLRASGLRHVPDEIRPSGFMSYQPSEIGPRPVLELYAAGLKVGQEMARARLGGAAPQEAARIALQRSPAMDFQGDLAWT